MKRSVRLAAAMMMFLTSAVPAVPPAFGSFGFDGTIDLAPDRRVIVW